MAFGIRESMGGGMEHSDSGAYIGQSVRRREDPRLLRGQGVYVADVRLPGMAHMAVLRSPHAHARIVRVDTSRAREVPGALAALSLADVGASPARLPMLRAPRRCAPQRPLAGRRCD